MSKLEDKFKNEILECKDGFISIETASKQCVEIAEEFAVGFSDWIVLKGYKLMQPNYSNNGGMWFYSEKSIGASTEELLELYKQHLKTKEK